jgi:hypothetical protein
MGLKLCFVIGPIGPEDSDVRTHADWLLEEIIQPVMNDFPEYQVRRADQDHRPGLIDAQLINDLLTAELVIADLSGLNPNAFYEIGMCALPRCTALPGGNPGRQTLAPAGSTRGGPGGDEWPEALREKSPIGGQRTVRAATRVNIEQASKKSMWESTRHSNGEGRRRR